MSAPVPENEEERLRALDACRILDTPPEPEFDDITLLAAQICGVPLAAVSLIDRDRQWFKSILGLDATETPRDAAFCAHTILQPELMLVPDAQSDPRFSDNPLVTGDLGIRFYAGMPLIMSDGFALGSLCVIDRKPRQLNAEQQTALRALGNQVASQLELKRHIAAQQRLIAERLIVEQQLQAEVAERRRAEAELERVLLQNAQVLASISSILIGVDSDGLISTWNGAAGYGLLQNIPRLEPVAAIVRFQNRHYDGTGFPEGGPAGAEIPCGARMLKVLLDLADIEARHISRRGAFTLMLRQAQRYDPHILAAARLCLHEPAAPGPASDASVALPLNRLAAGHILTKDVVTAAGKVLLQAGRQINDMLLEMLHNYAALVSIQEPLCVRPAR